jgi:hypothetical protein
MNELREEGGSLIDADRDVTGAAPSFLYLDVEFNGHGGELISMALAAPDGHHWYEVMPEPRVWNEWVFDNVFPHISKPSVEPEYFRASLQAFLSARPNSTIVADWPDDFVHLMRAMSGPSYEKSWIVPCTLLLLKESEPKPEVPHNALSDAIALMEWHRSQ